ncbi:unnamed protein product [Caenorhabditis auriculariae]|uniref:Uncharacterized protein n=1 Tax=Caenorhabditis auriculariae TaxID=2777116 RepID=A0A8S1HAL2_9PELO|nr:unnamed protein product [Caenorhabditis auriculariae]
MIWNLGRMFKNVYLHVGHSGCEEYTGLTTFHGMIRIFKSSTWTSLIFWCFVVVSCLVFYMIFCGYMITNYAYAATFQRVNYSTIQSSEIKISFNCEDLLFASKEPVCSNISSSNCVQISPSHYKFTFSSKLTGFDMYLGDNDSVIEMSAAAGLHKHVVLETTQVGNNGWKDLPWGVESELPYSIHNCEKLRLVLLKKDTKQCDFLNISPFYEGFNQSCVIEKPPNLQKNYPCYPVCRDFVVRVSKRVSKSSREKTMSRFTIYHSPTVKLLEETRKMGIVDVLCYLGGASSLFMGCSCITLMEMFIFLFKLVAQSACSKKENFVIDDKSIEAPKPMPEVLTINTKLSTSPSEPPRRPSVHQHRTRSVEAKFGASTSDMAVEASTAAANKRVSVQSLTSMSLILMKSSGLLETCHWNSDYQLIIRIGIVICADNRQLKSTMKTWTSTLVMKVKELSNSTGFIRLEEESAGYRVSLQEAQPQAIMYK